MADRKKKLLEVLWGPTKIIRRRTSYYHSNRRKERGGAQKVHQKNVNENLTNGKKVGVPEATHC